MNLQLSNEKLQYFPPIRVCPPLQNIPTVLCFYLPSTAQTISVTGVFALVANLQPNISQLENSSGPSSSWVFATLAFPDKAPCPLLSPLGSASTSCRELCSLPLCLPAQTSVRMCCQQLGSLSTLVLLPFSEFIPVIFQVTACPEIKATFQCLKRSL